MKSLTGLTGIFTLLSLLFFSSLGTPAQKPQLKTDDNSAYTLPPGTVIRVRMDNGIDSKSANVNDTFTTTVSVPVFVRTVEVVPAGTVIEGRVIRVEHAKRGGMAGFIVVAFETLRLPGGSVRKIAGELSDADEEDDPSDSDIRRVEGDETGTERVAFITGGAGAGALVGGLTKGRSGAVIGGVIGAGAGALASFLRRGEEASIKTNAQLAIVLKQSVTLPAQDF